MNWKSISEIIVDPISGEWGEEGDGVKVLRTTNFSNDGRLNLSDVVKRNVDLKKIEKKKLKVGDSIIEKSGGSPSQPVGRVVYFDVDDEDFICNNFTSVLRLKNDDFDSRYFFWNLFYQHSVKNTLKFQNKTTGIINLQLQRYLTETKIKHVSIITQRHIASILDKADALRQQNRQLLNYYDELLQSTFIEMFGNLKENQKWETTKIGDLTRVSSGGTPSREKAEYYDGNIPWVKTTEVSGQIILTTEESITELGLKNSSCKIYPKDSIIIAMYGQGKTRGQVGLLGLDATTNQACGVITPSSKYNPIFLFHQLRFRYEELRALGRGGNQANLNSGMIKDFFIMNPPLSLQNTFAEIATQLGKQKSIAENSLKEGKALFKTLLEHYFTLHK